LPRRFLARAAGQLSPCTPVPPPPAASRPSCRCRCAPHLGRLHLQPFAALQQPLHAALPHDVSHVVLVVRETIEGEGRVVLQVVVGGLEELQQRAQPAGLHDAGLGGRGGRG
jgi:hypothetical protein